MKIDLEALSSVFMRSLSSIGGEVVPYIRRLFRFLALPYCFSKVNWIECPRSKIQVAADFFYIFFFLKYFPDNYSPCRLWEKNRSEWMYYYGSNYDPYQRRKLRKIVQPKVYEIVFQDKVLSAMLCKANNIETPEVIKIVKEGESLERIATEFASSGDGKLIFKPRSGKGGNNIICTEFSCGTVRTIRNGEYSSIVGINADNDMIVQNFIKQHENMSKISSSTNTIRVVTLKKRNGDILIVGTYARFGVGISRVDNLSQGGICVSVDIKSGGLASIGFNRLSQVFTKHPTSGLQFEGYKVPLWDEVIALAKNVQKSFDFYPLLGMDIAVSEEGPLVIEINSSYDNVDLEQARGPILKNPEVYQAFEEYDLFINKYQKNLRIIHQGG